MIKGLKIIDLSTVLAGPSVGMFFAELGARVVKYENPKNPDVTRTWKLASEAKDSPVSAYFSSINYGKKYASLNLKNEDDYKNLWEELKTADILVSNFKKGDAEKFNLSDSKLEALNPRLIHGKISGFGLDSDRVAYDLILQAESGLMSMNGTPESGPVKMPLAFIDVLAAHQLKEGLLLALLDRTQTGKGKVVHVSLYKAAISSLINQASGYLMEKIIPKRIGSLHPNIAPYGEIFETCEGTLITFAIGSQAHFERLCAFVNRNELVTDNRFCENQQRVIHRAELAAILALEIKKYPAGEITSYMEGHFVPCGIIKNLAEVFEEKAAQDMVRSELISGVETKRVSTIAFE